MLDLQITDFWSWFTENCDKLHSDNYDRAVLRKLDDTICDWGLTWEIGPGSFKENSLTISPNGDKSQLEKSIGIFDKAPQLRDWDFYYAKRAKENWQIARLVDINFDINASNWTYVILRYEDEKNELLLKAANLSKLDKETKELAADIILTNLLGEKLKIEKIDFFDIVTDFESDAAVTNLKFLPAHINDKRYFTR